MNPPQVWKAVGAILLVCALQLYGQPTASGAATCTTFDPLGSTSTQPQSINPAGVITGYYFDANFVAHGFLRAPNGTLTTFDPPGYPNNTLAINSVGNSLAINPAATITGSYVDNISGYVHGFLRVTTGGEEQPPKVTFTTFDVPGPPGSPPQALTLWPSTRWGRSRDTTLTVAALLTASCGLPTVSSPPSIPRGPYSTSNRSTPRPSTRRERSRVFTQTQASCFTASCGPQYTVANGINPAGAIIGFYTENLHYTTARITLSCGPQR
jgi:hypothetical protein